MVGIEIYSFLVVSLLGRFVEVNSFAVWKDHLAILTDHDDEVTAIATASSSRRQLMAAMLGVGISTAGSLCSAAPAWAVKERNEALCGTGFFTNIAQYKCTEIGDISEDGKVQPLSASEEGSMESLLGKLGMDDSSSAFVDEESQTGGGSTNGKKDTSSSSSKL